MDNIQGMWDEVVTYLTLYGLDVLGAIAILIIGWMLANWLSKKVRQRSEQSKTIDATLTPLLARITKILVLLITVMAVLNQFGIQTTSLVALLGALGLAIGLAWQGTLADVAAGVMLLVMRPFNVGDAIEAGGETGTVEEIGLIVTKLNTFDNVAVVMPNSNVWSDTIKNFSANENRRVDMVVGFGYDDDMDSAVQVIKQILDADDRVLDIPEPQIAISELGDNAVSMIVRPWTTKDNYWPLKFDLTKRIKERFDEESISFPYPQRDVHIHQQD